MPLCAMPNDRLARAACTATVARIIPRPYEVDLQGLHPTKASRKTCKEVLKAKEGATKKLI